MKKIINGKMYNTETAKLIASCDNGLGCHELYYVCEELYKKKTGEFFLLGTSGSGGMYAQPAEGGFSASGSEIIPYTVGKAKKWLEENASADAYIAAFGEVEE